MPVRAYACSCGVPIGSLPSRVRERAYTLALLSRKCPHPHAALPSPPSPLRAVSPTLGCSWTLALPPFYLALSSSSHHLAHPDTHAPSPTLALSLSCPSCHLATSLLALLLTHTAIAQAHCSLAAALCPPRAVLLTGTRRHRRTLTRLLLPVRSHLLGPRAPTFMHATMCA